METISIGIQNLLAPCHCACKYCLLQSCKKADNGIDYNRGKKFAERFVCWGKEKGLPDLPYYFIGYCAEYPELFDNIAFNRSVGFIGASFLQCNGIRIRNETETDEFIGKLKPPESLRLIPLFSVMRDITTDSPPARVIMNSCCGSRKARNGRGSPVPLRSSSPKKTSRCWTASSAHWHKSPICAISMPSCRIIGDVDI